MTEYQTFFFNLNISYLECRVFYTGQLSNVLLIAENGKTVQVPTHNLRRFVTSTGLKGRYRLLVNHANKIVSFEQIC